MSAERSPAILDIGCGPNKTPGAVGLDRHPFPGVDVVRDLMRGLPFADSTFDAIVAKHVLEHFGGMDLLFLVDEMWRVSKPGAQWLVVVPDASSPNRYRDPTHVTRDWSEDSFLLWQVNDGGEWPIFVGPDYGRHAKLKLHGTDVSDHQQRNRTYSLEAVKP